MRMASRVYALDQLPSKLFCVVEHIDADIRSAWDACGAIQYAREDVGVRDDCVETDFWGRCREVRWEAQQQMEACPVPHRFGVSRLNGNVNVERFRIISSNVHIGQHLFPHGQELLKVVIETSSHFVVCVGDSFLLFISCGWDKFDKKDKTIKF